MKSSQGLGKSLALALGTMAIVGVIVAVNGQNNESKDIRSHASSTACLPAGSVENCTAGAYPCCSPAKCIIDVNGGRCVIPTPTPQYQTYVLTSGTCSNKCLTSPKPGTCVSVGLDANGTDGRMASWDAYKAGCVAVAGRTCGSAPQSLTAKTGGYKCQFGTTTAVPEWTICRCLLNSNTTK